MRYFLTEAVNQARTDSAEGKGYDSASVWQGLDG